MENDNFEDKSFIEKYGIIILTFLVLIIILILLLPSKESKTKENTIVDSNLTLTLKGSKNISIIKGNNYEEPGYYAYDSVDGELTRRVIIIGNIDTNTIGSYTLKYEVTNNSGKKAREIRTINVIANLKDLKIEVSYIPKELTNKDVTIRLKMSGSGYDFVLDPAGNVVKDNILEYKVNENGEYLFSIKRKDGNVIEKKSKLQILIKKNLKVVVKV